MTDKSVIVAAVRTPFGSFQGALSPMKTTDIGAAAISGAIEKVGIGKDLVGEVIMGCVLPAGLGQNPARQATISAGLPVSVGALTINKVCSSGLYSVVMADRQIRLGETEVIIAGGMDSMTNSPYLLPKARAGLRMGNAELVDSMIHDGLWEVYNDYHMGLCAEALAEKYAFTREMQDAFAESSYRRAQDASESGAFADEIIPVSVPKRRGDPIIFDCDEEPARVDFERMKTLRTAFKRDGTVTAANASSISDGAAALLVMSEKRAESENLAPLAEIISHATFSHEPEWFTTAPIGAAKLALKRAGLSIADIDLFEINEAFSGVTMAAMKEFELDPDSVNINGGAVAIGHPIGASGARILVTLVHALKGQGKKRGLAAICNGGGEATAMIVEVK